MERKQENLKEKIIGYMSGLEAAIPMDHLYEIFSAEWVHEADLYPMREVHSATLELISEGKLKFCDKFQIATARVARVLEPEKGKTYREGEILAAYTVNDDESYLEGLWVVQRQFNEGMMRKLVKISHYEGFEPSPCVFQLLAGQGYIKQVPFTKVYH